MSYSLRAAILLLTLLVSTEALAQDPPAPYLRIDFMKSTGSDYEDVESTIWKPHHQDRVDGGDKIAWNLFWVNYGDRTDHDYVTVNVYPDLASTYGEWDSLAADFARVHPGVDMEEAIDRTDGSRDMVRSEQWRGVLFEGVHGPYRYAVTNYMLVPAGGGEEYVALERDWWAPIHRAAIENGCEGAWGVYELQQPFGSKLPYNYAAVNFANEWKPECDFMKTAAEVHPETDWSAIEEKTQAARELVLGVEWMLLDHTADASASN